MNRLHSVFENMLKLAVVLAIVACAHAALVLAPLEKKPDKFKDQQGCYMKELDAVIPFGESRPSNNKCVEYRCGEDMVTFASCGVVVAIPPCTLVIDKSKPYPQCCPKPSCE